MVLSVTVSFGDYFCIVEIREKKNKAQIRINEGAGGAVYFLKLLLVEGECCENLFSR